MAKAKKQTAPDLKTRVKSAVKRRLGVGGKQDLTFKQALKEPPKRKLKLLDKLKIVETIDVPDSDLKFSVTSMTEFNRVTRMKEPWTAEWVQSLPEDSVLWDIGANIGLFSLLAAEQENVNFVVAIEPSSLNASAIWRNAGLNGLTGKIILVPGGVGEETGMRFLNLQNTKPGGALHSFGDIIYAGGEKTPETVHSEPSYLFRLDDLVRFDGMPFPTHLKIDIDGYEMTALKGAPKLLADQRLKAIQIEVMEPDGITALRDEVTGLITGYGFEFDEAIHHGSHSIATDLRFKR